MGLFLNGAFVGYSVYSKAIFGEIIIDIDFRAF